MSREKTINVRCRGAVISICVLLTRARKNGKQVFPQIGSQLLAPCQLPVFLLLLPFFLSWSWHKPFDAHSAACVQFAHHNTSFYPNFLSHSFLRQSPSPIKGLLSEYWASVNKPGNKVLWTELNWVWQGWGNAHHSSGWVAVAVLY